MSDDIQKIETLDLDAKRENEGFAHTHTVRLNGKAWRIKARVRPEAFVAYLNMDAKTPDEEVAPIMDNLIRAILVPGDRDAWDEARAADTDESDISLGDMEAIIQWATPLLTGRPLARRSDSSPSGLTPTREPVSEAESSSPEATPPLSIAGTS